VAAATSKKANPRFGTVTRWAALGLAALFCWQALPAAR
jgi:hypothetical protein